MANYSTPPGFPAYSQFARAEAPAAAYDDPRGDYGFCRDADTSVDMRQRSYSTLGGRMAMHDDSYAPARPSTAPLPIPEGGRRESSDQANLALLISSMQALTAVVAQHGEELRHLREENRSLRAAAAVAAEARDQSTMALQSMTRMEARFAALERAASSPAPAPQLWAQPASAISRPSSSSAFSDHGSETHAREWSTPAYRPLHEASSQGGFLRDSDHSAFASSNDPRLGGIDHHSFSST
ncbi:hypothetical protein M885DRAFT_513176 [Pelagophyceae sp. CCMP2097]|nr:hypothetical protein M885DRAFT_513176 [Pelagophyceae sp. CCMP2097]|mmetsp:Transcript_12071/g.40255  ORF Transcript_12071/g.40255 Transcript_12071/m.40255 type:complete len:240 (-) Transcript_12071:138-857(-)